MTGLQQPVVVDPQAPNFEGVHLTIQCLPGERISEQEATALCYKLRTLFRNQGAEVTLRYEGVAPRPGEAPEDAPPLTELALEVRSRETHRSNDPLLATVSGLTLTIVPAVSESTFVQEVIVRDGSGFLLASESLQGRLVRYEGVGAWAGNALLNSLVRDEEDRILEDTASKDLSADLYGQLSQIVFNARVQAELMQHAAGASARP